jgi:UDP-N-acetylmuramoylalanine--D-glutamate ligase
MLDLSGQKVLVLGLGVSGRSAATFCAARGASVVAADERDASALVGLGDLDPRVEQRLGAEFPDRSDFDLVVPSPGIPRERWERGTRRAWGDIELAWRALEIPIVAVTGTNGKSTTSLLIAAMLRATGLRCRAAGNVGDPALDLVGEALDVAVLEVSSFQLEAVDEFRPRVAVILNITPDHLDRHGEFASYVEAKSRILRRQQPDDAAVLNLGDPAVRALSELGRGRVFAFAGGTDAANGAWLDAGSIVVHLEDAAPRRISLDGMALRGSHNLENAMAALCAVAALGADPVRAAGALATFTGLPHRMEAVASIGGVAFVNDSKATNPEASVRALESTGQRVVWIAGGRDKGLQLDALKDAAAAHVRELILIGEAAPKLQAELGGVVPTRIAETLDAAVSLAYELAAAGDTVLLSPACASQDQFRDFEERGERFRAAVERLAAERGS